MGVRNLEDLRAYQLARAFKRECYRLVREHPRAAADLRFVDQLFDAASGGEMNIGEGYDRYVAGDIVRFLRIAISSMREAVLRVNDGIDRGHFTHAEAAHALDLGESARRTTIALHNSLLPFVKKGHASRWTDPTSNPPSRDETAQRDQTPRREPRGPTEPSPRTPDRGPT